jgi:CubicO group peptidase (beta-lactamase class C family)
MIEVPLTMVAYPYDDRKHRYPVPGAGLFSTADDCLAFIQVWANRGVYHGTRILSEASFHEMTSLRNKGLGRAQYGFGIDVGKGNISHSGHHKTFIGAHMKTGTVLVLMTQVDGKPELPVDGKVETIDRLWDELLDLGDRMNTAATTRP